MTTPPQRTITPPDMCPICNGLPRNPKTRKGVNGHWCMPCQDEFDNIDWEEYYERQREGR